MLIFRKGYYYNKIIKKLVECKEEESINDDNRRVIAIIRYPSNGINYNNQKVEKLSLEIKIYFRNRENA